MNLEDLFVSHKQVEPISFLGGRPIEIEDIYINFNRAQKAAENSSEDMSSWSVKGSSDGAFNWVVSNKPKEPQKEPTTSDNAEVEKQPIQENTSVTEPAKKVENYSTQGVERKPNDWNNPYSNNSQLWISDLTDAYRRAGVKESAIKNLLAKNALEASWGSSAQGAYNFGNLTTGKYWKGDYVVGRDKDGKGRPIRNKFRSYNNLDEFVSDELQFLRKLYDFDDNDDFDTFVHKLLGGNKAGRRYAEAPNYADIIRGTYRKL